MWCGLIPFLFNDTTDNLGLGIRGVEKRLKINVPALGKSESAGSASDQGVRLAKSLKEANERFARKGSVAREVFGDEFVDHFSGTREHETRLWDEAVTDWSVCSYFQFISDWQINALYREVRRYIETV